jgi:hypothetical protein
MDPRGYYHKFNIYRRNHDGTDGDLVEERTFTLIPDHDPAALSALRCYAAAVEDQNAGLAADLRSWVDEVQA